MAGLLNKSSVLMCPHGGMVQVITTNTRTKVGGDFALRASDTFLISGCPFSLGPVYHPCVKIQWLQPAQRSQAVSDFTLTEQSVGMCLAADQAPQGNVIVAFTQPQVAGQ